MKKLIVAALIFPVYISAQNVGIGTLSPGSKLHVVSPSGETIRVEGFQSFITFYTAGTQRGFIGNTGNGMEIGSNPGFNGPIVFSPEGVPIMKVHPGGMVRIEGSTGSNGIGFSMGGFGEFQVDKNGIPAGRFVIQEIGRVGIGIPQPTTELDVAGIVRATGFRLASPKTYYYAIHPAAFISSHTPADFRENLGAYMVASPTYSDLRAPVNLPHNAIVKRIRIQVHDISPTQDVHFNLYKLQPNGASSALISMSSSGSAGYALLESGPLSILIDNSDGAYGMVAFTLSNWLGNAIIVRGIFFEYTLSEL